MTPLSVLALGLLLGAAPGSSATVSSCAPDGGTWQGTLKAPKGDLAVFLRWHAPRTGGFAGELSIPAAGLLGLQLVDPHCEGGALSFRIPALKASYAGSFAAGVLAGTWSQPLGSLPLRLEPASSLEAPAALFSRAQTPTPPFPYRAVEVRFPSADPAVTLAGTLTLPAGRGPFPAAILLSVAGPNDRDQSYAGHRPFFVLADYLTRKGIAVLRWDGRGVGESTGKTFQATVSDLANDAVAGLRFLESRPEIDPHKIGFVGNSEGGEIGPLAATRSAAAFVVMLAGPGLPGTECIRAQTVRLAELRGYGAREIEELRSEVKDRLDEILRAPEATVLEQRLAQMSAKAKVPIPSAAVLTTGGVDAEIAMYLSPWYQSELRYDPRPALRALRVPVLALTGSLDPVLPADQHLPPILEALLAGQAADATVARVPEVNHLLQPAKTGLPEESFTLDQTVAKVVLERVATWIADRFLTKQ